MDLPSVGRNDKDKVTLGQYEFTPKRAIWYAEMLVRYAWVIRDLEAKSYIEEGK